MTLHLLAWRYLTSGAAFLSRLSARVGCDGAVAIITAICSPVLIMIVGFAADYGYASYINQRLARATDSATLGSVSQTAATTAGGYDKTSALQTIGSSVFTANIADLSSAGVTFSLSVVSDGAGGVIATGSYAYKCPTFFGGLLGIDTISLSGTAKTTARPVVYVNYYILVDNSQSMGIGTTQADMTALYQRVLAYGNAAPPSGNPSQPGDGGCVFGCHNKQVISYTSWGQPIYQKYTNEDLAHNVSYGAPITLRIDSAVTAVNNIIKSAQQIAGTTKNIAFGIYTIGEDSSTGKGVQFIKNPPTTDYTAAQAAVSTIDLINTDGSQSTGNTDFHDEITDFLAGLSPALTQGSGASATSPLNYIFLITDGINDVRGNCNKYKLCSSPIDAYECNVLKKNAIVGVIYTTYLPIYQFNGPSDLEDRFDVIMGAPQPAQAKLALQNCATSSDWFFEAQDGPTLISAVQALFQRTQPSSARITQ